MNRPSSRGASWPNELVWIVELNHPGGIFGPNMREDFEIMVVDARTGRYVSGEAGRLPGLEPPPPMGK